MRAWFSEHTTPDNAPLSRAESVWRLFLPIKINYTVAHVCSTTWRGLTHALQPLQGALAWAMREAPRCSAPDPKHHLSKHPRARWLGLLRDLRTASPRLFITDQNGSAVCTSGHESGLRPREIAACRLLKEDAPRWLGNTSQQRMSLHTYIAELHARVQAFCVSQTNFASDYSLKFMLKKITITWLPASASALTKFISPWRSISWKRFSSHTQFSDVHFTDD